MQIKNRKLAYTCFAGTEFYFRSEVQTCDLVPDKGIGTAAQL